MKKRVLLYYPPNKRSVAIETLCKAVVDAGHYLTILTLTEKGSFHEAMEKQGISTYSHVLERRPTWKYFLQHGRHLAKFCKEHRIDIIWSHLQEANIIALMAKYFIRPEVIAFRHHAESAFYAEYGKIFGMERNKNEEKLDKIINRIADKIIVPSSGVWYGMDKYEKCNMSKVVLAPYIYDFSAYAKPDINQVELLNDSLPCHLRLIMVSRMISSKQHMPVFKILNKLVKEGLSVKMIVMDDGPLRQELEKYIKENELEEHIKLVGFRTDFINFMASADLLIHPSLTEASNNVVKEIGLLEKGVAVCKNVGDFDDYILDGKNGFLIDRGNLEESIEKIIRKAYVDKAQLKEMGKALRQDVIRLFSDTPENKKRFTDLLQN